MENTTKAILIGVGLFITIALISAVLVIMNVGNNMINDSQNELQSISDTLTSEMTDNFDGKIVQGAEVLAFMKKHHSSQEVSVALNNTASSKEEVSSTLTGFNWVGAYKYQNLDNTKVGTKLTSSDRIARSDLTNNGKADYVSTNSRYAAELITMNGDVVGVAFQKIQ